MKREMKQNKALKLSMLGVAFSSLMTTACAPGLTLDSSLELDPRFDKSGSVRFVQDGVSASALGDVSAQASGLSISLALSILPPATSNTGGQQLYASDLKVVGSKVITGYNVPGNVQKGWLDYVDVTTIAIPLLINSVSLPDTDVNSLAMHSSGKFALVGAKDSIGSTLRTGTFNALGMTLNSGDTYLSSYAGTGVAYDSTAANLAVTTGDTGGVQVMNASTLVSAGSSTISDARGVTYHTASNKFYTVKGQTGSVSAISSAGAVTATTALGGATIAQSKATIVGGSTFLLATTGDGGFNVICAADMKVAATQAQYTYANYASLNLPAPALTVTNAAAFGPGMIFTASGQAGVRVYNFVKASGTSPTACQNVAVSYMGTFEFDRVISVNNVVYANVLTTALTYTGTLYVAAGAGGFKAVTVVATRNALNDIIEY